MRAFRAEPRLPQEPQPAEEQQLRQDLAVGVAREVHLREAHGQRGRRAEREHGSQEARAERVEREQRQPAQHRVHLGDRARAAQPAAGAERERQAVEELHVEAVAGCAPAGDGALGEHPVLDTRKELPRVVEQEAAVVGDPVSEPEVDAGVAVGHHVLRGEVGVHHGRRERYHHGAEARKQRRSRTDRRRRPLRPREP